MAMARNCYVFAFLTIWSLLCVSALDEGGNSFAKDAETMTEVFASDANVVGDSQISALEDSGNFIAKEGVKAEGDVQILRLPSEEESRSQEIPWEQNPIQIHSLPFPRRPMVGEEKEMEMENLPNFEPGKLRPVRFRFGRPRGCHGKFRQSLMAREDPSQPQFLRRMGMGHHRHAHAHAHAHPYSFPAIEDGEKTSATAFHAHLKAEKEGMGFEMQREKGFEGGFGEREEEERGGPWTAWVRNMFH